MKRILITGASAGLGEALAKEAARRYGAANVTLGLLARRRDKLEALASELTQQGAAVLVLEADVTDAKATATAIGQFAQQAGGLDVLIANAGIGLPDLVKEGNPENVNQVFEVNVGGVVNSLWPAVPIMEEAGQGHLVAIASVAGTIALPAQAAYSASKSAVISLVRSLRVRLGRRGIKVTALCPGYIRTDMTAKNAYPMPFIMGAEKAARLMWKAIEKNKGVYLFPWQMRWLSRYVFPLIPKGFLMGFSKDRSKKK